jgi:hypothetical protein
MAPWLVEDHQIDFVVLLAETLFSALEFARGVSIVLSRDSPRLGRSTTKHHYFHPSSLILDLRLRSDVAMSLGSVEVIEDYRDTVSHCAMYLVASSGFLQGRQLACHHPQLKSLVP